MRQKTECHRKQQEPHDSAGRTGDFAQFFTAMCSGKLGQPSSSPCATKGHQVDVG